MSGALHGPGKVLVLEMTLQIDETGRGITEWKLLADFKVERISIIMPLRSSEEERAILLKGTTEISIEGSEGVRSRTGVIDGVREFPLYPPVVLRKGQVVVLKQTGPPGMRCGLSLAGKEFKS